MNDENRKSVPNLSREELNAKLDELRQKKAGGKTTTRRSFFGRFMGALVTLVTFGWLGGCKKAQVLCYSQPNPNVPDEPEMPDDPEVLCYKVAPNEDGTMPEMPEPDGDDMPEPTCYEPAIPEEEMEEPAEEPTPAEETPHAAESKNTNDSPPAERGSFHERRTQQPRS